MLLSLLVAASLSLPLQTAEDRSGAEEEAKKGLLRHEEGAFDGYTLFAPLLSKTTYLIDMDGAVVHEWPSEYPPGNSAFLMDDGTLLRCGRMEDSAVFRGGGIGGRVQLLAWDGSVLWDFVFADEQRWHHHDIAPMPNGHVLLIAWEHLPPADAIGLGRDRDAVGGDGFWPDAVFEVQPTPPSGGEIVWEWHVWDHLVQDTDPAKPFYGTAFDDPGRVDVNADHRDRAPLSEEELAREREREMRALGYVGGDEDEEEEEAQDGGADGGRAERQNADWLHTNAIDYDAEHDWIVLSTPHLDEIWIIDHSTTTEEAATSSGGRWGKGGDLLYRWGNPRTYGAGGEGDRKLYSQHHAHWIPAGHPGAGHILLFNNGEGRPDGDYSSVDELVLPFDPERGFLRESGQAFGPVEPVWSYRAPDRTSFYSGFISGAQRLANGNTLVCSGAQGRMFEVTAAGEIVWEYLNPYGGDVRPGAGRPPPPDAPSDDGAPPRGGPPGGIDPKALFRATRIAPDHPGLHALAR